MLLLKFFTLTCHELAIYHQILMSDFTLVEFILFIILLIFNLNFIIYRIKVLLQKNLLNKMFISI